MNLYYKLEGHTPVQCADAYEWAHAFELAARTVAVDMVGAVKVSTVFLGMDHAFGGGKPLLFETMVFGGPLDQAQDRCSTWEEAEAQHAVWVERVKTGRDDGVYPDFMDEV